jgi:hypothetical protein
MTAQRCLERERVSLSVECTALGAGASFLVLNKEIPVLRPAPRAQVISCAGESSSFGYFPFDSFLLIERALLTD